MRESYRLTNIGRTIVEELNEKHGYDTGAFSENVFLTDHPSGLSDIFETVVGADDVTASSGEHAPSHENGFAYADRFLKWQSTRESPWFACLNLMDAHRPFEPSSKYDQWGSAAGRRLQDDLPQQYEWQYYGNHRPSTELGLLKDLYDGSIRQCDAIVEQVVSALRSAGTLEETLLVVTADHGEGFGEPTELPGTPDAITHGIGVNDELLHVPLVVRPPGGGTGTRIDNLVSLTRLPRLITEHIERGASETGADPLSVSGRPVVAGRAAIDQNLYGEAKNHCSDPQRFDGRLRAVYNKVEGDVHKKVAWDRDASTVGFAGHRRFQIDSPPIGPLEKVNEVFEGFTRDTASVERSEETGPDDPVTQRLKNLGYLS